MPKKQTDRRRDAAEKAANLAWYAAQDRDRAARRPHTKVTWKHNGR